MTVFPEEEDGRLADLIRRVATFGMVLMKLDVRQVHIMKTGAIACPASYFPFLLAIS